MESFTSTVRLVYAMRRIDIITIMSVQFNITKFINNWMHAAFRQILWIFMRWFDVEVFGAGADGAVEQIVSRQHTVNVGTFIICNRGKRRREKGIN